MDIEDEIMKQDPLQTISTLNTLTSKGENCPDNLLKDYLNENFCSWKNEVLTSILKQAKEKNLCLLLLPSIADYIIVGKGIRDDSITLFFGYIFPTYESDIEYDACFERIALGERKLETFLNKEKDISVSTIVFVHNICEEETIKLADKYKLIYNLEIDDLEAAYDVCSLEYIDVKERYKAFVEKLEDCSGADFFESNIFYDFNKNCLEASGLCEDAIGDLLNNLLLDYPCVCYNRNGGSDSINKVRIVNGDCDLLEVALLYDFNIVSFHEYMKNKSDIYYKLYELLTTVYPVNINNLQDDEDYFNDLKDRILRASYSKNDNLSSKLKNINFENRKVQDFITDIIKIYNNNVSEFNISDLALNSAFVGNAPSAINRDVKAFAKCMNLLVDGQLNITEVEIGEQNQNEDANNELLSAFESNTQNSCIIIKNIDRLVVDRMAYEHYASKVIKQMQIIINAVEENPNTLVICTSSTKWWDKLLGQDPELRIIFQSTFSYKKPSVKRLKEYFSAQLNRRQIQLTDEATRYCEHYFEYLSKNESIDQLFFAPLDILINESNRFRLLRYADTSIKPGIKDFPIDLVDVELALNDEFAHQKDENYDAVMQELDTLEGLHSVKQKLKSLYAMVKVYQLRQDENIKGNAEVSLHSVFLGNPGTGKTTVAHLMGRALYSIGVLSSPKVVSVKRSDLVSQWLGGTAKQTRQIIEEAKGGVLFIDEAYDLFRQGDSKDGGQESANTLLSEMEDLNKGTCVILAGYPLEMKEMLKSNPGFESRFSNQYIFEDYSVRELISIFKAMLNANNYICSEDAMLSIEDLLKDLHNNKDRHWGNARVCRNLIQKLKIIHSQRIFTDYLNVNKKADAKVLTLITQADTRELSKEYKANAKVNAGYTIGFKS